MTLPANLRVNMSVPFPSLVVGAGPITVTKQNGIWTVGAAFQVLTSQTPPQGDFTHDYVLVWDSVVGNYFRMPLSGLFSSIPAVSTARLPAANAVVNIFNSDVEVGITTSLGTVCTLPHVAAWSAANQNGIELTIFDYSGGAATFPIGFTLNGTDHFTQGIVPIINAKYGLIKLRPIIDAVNGNSWYIRGIN